jgi:N-acetylmuramoyl-L-alanine amidase
MAKIAARHGYADFAELHGHPANAELRRVRPNPHLLYPGDRVNIPDRVARVKEVQAGAKHVFKVRRARVMLRLKLLGDDGAALANAEFCLTVGGTIVRGRTSGDGTIEARVPADVEEASLEIGGRMRRLRVGQLNPMHDTEDAGVSGVQARLANLGYFGGPIDGRRDEHLDDAVRRFRRDHGLDATATIDDAMKARLAERHGV